ncbi:hypothetical protein [Arthrobacter sp. A2-55]|jgi:hypothetical protein|uniref:hypothetical protein n=1 Tax=Arthrobacter sp. A2-55 TaxID=2897337 RepID=UPI0021CD4CDA|nr:hypothetical protein [Arthrobacter sp. A2-55]MCU6481897.1 hypothetical protein [Arthrobacter sp. A2-55]
MGKHNVAATLALKQLIAARQLLGLWQSRLARLLKMTPLRHLRLRPATGAARGDVPGWVLITLMSAVLVAGLLALAGPALEKLFNEAMSQVQP